MRNEVETQEAEPEGMRASEVLAAQAESFGASAGRAWKAQKSEEHQRQEEEKRHDAPLGEAKRAFPRLVETASRDRATTR